MIAYAAIDLREGQVVQLVGGVPGTERVRLPDAVAVARDWLDAGFWALHVVDLDAAFGSGDNRATIGALIESASTAGATVQVGGGLRDDDAVADLLDLGAARVIVGTRAVEDPGWLAHITRLHPGRVIAAVDVRGDEVVARAWTAGTGVDATEFLGRIDDLPLAGVLVTDVEREGSMVGAHVDRFRRLVTSTRHPLIAAGGIGSESDLSALAGAGAAGAVLGMALYTGAVDPRRTARAFAATPERHAPVIETEADTQSEVG